MDTPKRRRGFPPKKEEPEKPIKKVGRGRICDRRHLTEREAQYAEMIARGVPMELAAQEVNMTTKEAARLHAEHPLLEKKISEIRGDRQDQAIEGMVLKKSALLNTIHEQLVKKIDEGQVISVRELRDAYEMSKEVGPILAQDEYRKSHGGQKRVQDGDAIVLDIKELTLMELSEQINSPEMKDFNEKTFVRWFSNIGQSRQKRILQEIQH